MPADQYVVATAGHVDHGKSTLIRALTGMEPDRLAEERRRGLTLDLGFAWTTLRSGREVAFVDVPGHQRFLGNTLAGLGPTPVVCFVVAADEGWQAQSGDHRDALAALGVEHGVLVITRTDRAPGRVAGTLDTARAELAGTGLADAPAVAVSAVAGTGLDELRATLDGVLAGMEDPARTGRLRVWLDRAFTIGGAGTVVTGTLAAGTISNGDRLQLLGVAGPQPVTVRGLHSCGQPRTTLGPVTRAAVNLRGLPVAAVHRGDVLLTADAWPITRTVDVRRVSGPVFTAAPERLVAHVGTAAVPGRLRPLDAEHARLSLDRPLPLILGDRLVLRHPGGPQILGGARVLDADPPALTRRGAAARRAATLAARPDAGDVPAEVARRRAARPAQLRRLGLTADTPPAGVRVVGDWWVHPTTFTAWSAALAEAVQTHHERDPLATGMSRGAAVDLLDLPTPALLDAVVAAAGLEHADGRIARPGRRDDLGPAAAAVAELASRLAAEPFAAPESDELAALRLGPRELAAAERAGKLLRLGDAVVLLPGAPALAMRELARLDQPFTASAARRALGTTRRVMIPLLEHLDTRGWTRRTDSTHRMVVRGQVRGPGSPPGVEA